MLRLWHCSLLLCNTGSSLCPIASIVDDHQVNTSKACDLKATHRAACRPTDLKQHGSTCTVLGTARHPVAAIVFSLTWMGDWRTMKGWMGAWSRYNLWFWGKAVCARHGSRLTLGSILVFFRLRHFAAHRSQFGCVIPDLDKNRNPFNCWLSSTKSLPQVAGAEIRVLWREKCPSEMFL